MESKSIIIGSIAIIASIFFPGCGRSSSVSSNTPEPVPAQETTTTGDEPTETVKNGVLANYNSTTVGKAFEGTFQEPKWTTFETSKGQTVVEFNGLFSCSNDPVEAENGCRDKLIPIKFQFLLSADKQSFQVASVDRFADVDHALAFVYR